MFFRKNKNKSMASENDAEESKESPKESAKTTEPAQNKPLGQNKSTSLNKPQAVLADKILKTCVSFFQMDTHAHIHEYIDVVFSDDESCTIKLGFVANASVETLREFIYQCHPELAHQKLNVAYNIPIFSALKPHVTNIKNIVAVSSGKGGVGKSASAINIALALKEQGARVGILDADIYGPSVPIMLGTANESPDSPDNKHMIPIAAHGIVSNSIGYLVKNDHASIWRGPMASKALTQLTMETRWPMLDYLIVDMPPGTGDIQLTMAQMLPLTAAIVVTTPQDIALSDAEKGIAMFNKLNVPVLGLIENMSYFECPECHHQTAIFDTKGGHRLSEKYALPMLAEVPLNTKIREYADRGKSIFEQAEDKQIASIQNIYLRAAHLLSKQMCSQLTLSPKIIFT